MSDLVAELSERADVVYLRADYGDLAAVARLAGDVRAACPGGVDLLVNNAARPGPPSRTLSADGHEVTLQTNYLGAVCADHAAARRGGRRPAGARRQRRVGHALLGDAGARRPRVRPVGLLPSTACARYKLALVSWSCRLATQRPRDTVDVVSVHPGVIATGLLHAMFSVGGDSPSTPPRRPARRRPARRRQRHVLRRTAPGHAEPHRAGPRHPGVARRVHPAGAGARSACRAQAARRDPPSRRGGSSTNSTLPSWSPVPEQQVRHARRHVAGAEGAPQQALGQEHAGPGQLVGAAEQLGRHVRPVHLDAVPPRPGRAARPRRPSGCVRTRCASGANSPW